MRTNHENMERVNKVWKESRVVKLFHIALVKKMRIGFN